MTIADGEAYAAGATSAAPDRDRSGAASDAEISKVVASVRRTAAAEFGPDSRLYERLANGVADRPELLMPLLAAPPVQRRALLYFAAIAHLLRTTVPRHPLADWYPVLGGTREATGGDPVAALADFVDAHRAGIEQLCATRTTQTNEVRRAALLRPAFGRAAEVAGVASGTGQLALIELGTSAGLLLATDRYAIRYHDGLRTQTYGDGDLTIDCDLRGGEWPTPAGVAVAVSSRTGIDLAPIAPGDAEGAAWLHACIWPEHTERDARLDLALAEVAKVRPAMVTADMRAGLAAAVSNVPTDVLPCVFTSHAMAYLNAEGRSEVIRALDAIGAVRDLVVVMNEASMLHAWSGPVPRSKVGITTHVTFIAWRGGAATVEVLAEADAHGRWLTFQPQVYEYAPPGLVGAADHEPFGGNDASRAA